MKDPNAVEIPAAHAYLIIPFRHLTRVEYLSGADWKDVGYLFEHLRVAYSLAGGILGMRFGDPAVSGQTMRHLHFHVIVPPAHPTEEGKVVPVPFWAG